MPPKPNEAHWRLRDLAWWIFEAFRISLDETTVGRELRTLGYRKLSARPRHRAQDEGTVRCVALTSSVGPGQ